MWLNKFRLRLDQAGEKFDLVMSKYVRLRDANFGLVLVQFGLWSGTSRGYLYRRLVVEWTPSLLWEFVHDVEWRI